MRFQKTRVLLLATFFAATLGSNDAARAVNPPADFAVEGTSHSGGAVSATFSFGAGARRWWIQRGGLEVADWNARGNWVSFNFNTFSLWYAWGYNNGQFASSSGRTLGDELTGRAFLWGFEGVPNGLYQLSGAPLVVAAVN